MLLGLLFALGACLLWGTIFVVPQFLPEFSAMEVALGRYVSFGLFSLFLLIFKKMSSYPLKMWKIAFAYGLIANVLYYIGVVMGVRFATPPVTVLVVGMCPVFAAIYSNFHTKDFSFRSLAIPCLVMTFGIVLVNAMEIDWTFGHSSLKEYLVGMAGATTALLTWSWYAVQNARLLKRHPELSRTDWATMIGVSTLFWVFLLGLFLSFGENAAIDIRKFFHFTPANLRFFLLTAFLGVVCAWVGCYLWNKASSLLPIAMMGPFIIFETLFGLFFVFLFDFRFPSLIEFSGIMAMMIGIILCFTLHRKHTTNKHPA